MILNILTIILTVIAYDILSKKVLSRMTVDCDDGLITLWWWQYDHKLYPTGQWGKGLISIRYKRSEY